MSASETGLLPCQSVWFMTDVNGKPVEFTTSEDGAAAWRERGYILTEYRRAPSHAALLAEVERYKEALTPSGDTKAAYIGEFDFDIEDRDEDGEECSRTVTVPWTTVKEIMKAIAARAAFEQSHEG